MVVNDVVGFFAMAGSAMAGSAGCSFAKQVTTDIQSLALVNGGWRGRFEWQIDAVGRVVRVKDDRRMIRIVRPLTLPGMACEGEGCVACMDGAGGETCMAAVYIMLKLEHDRYTDDNSIKRVLNINYVELDESLRGLGFFAAFISTLEVWLDSDEGGGGCNCDRLLVSNICNERLDSHLARRSPCWKNGNSGERVRVRMRN